jgi:hypothetical protein
MRVLLIAVMMEAVRTSGMSVYFHRTARPHILEAVIFTLTENFRGFPQFLQANMYSCFRNVSPLLPTTAFQLGILPFESV